MQQRACTHTHTHTHRKVCLQGFGFIVPTGTSTDLLPLLQVLVFSASLIAEASSSDCLPGPLCFAHGCYWWNATGWRQGRWDLLACPDICVGSFWVFFLRNHSYCNLNPHKIATQNSFYSPKRPYGPVLSQSGVPGHFRRRPERAHRQAQGHPRRRRIWTCTRHPLLQAPKPQALVSWGSWVCRWQRRSGRWRERRT